jgi:hypothetical protein
MSIVVLVVISVIVVLVAYLGVAATVCILRDRSLALKLAGIRILISWLVPLLGPILMIKVAAEELSQGLQSCWWLWPLKWILSDRTADSVVDQVIDVRADAERILPGSTTTPLL